MAGEIKYLQWTFYDYFWPSIQGYTSFDTYDLLVSSASKMKYVWVLNGNVWQLKAHSNNAQTHETHTTRGYKNNSLQTVSTVKKNTIWGVLYDQIETLAVTEGITTISDPVRSFFYENDKGSKVLSVFPHYASRPLDLY